MTREQFEALVARLEAAAAESPRRYKARVAAFALLGYAYLAFVVVALLGLLALAAASVVYLKAIGVKLVLLIAPVVWLVLRSFVVRIAPPDGIEITRRDAPDLFERIERLRKAVGAPRFHHVVVNADFNAAVTQVPLLGPFGWHRNYLLLGLPFLRAMRPHQLDAVIAHELGHLAGGHARFNNWLYRLRMIWTQLQEELQRSGRRGGDVLRAFFDWYAPRFNAYSFPLARANEYEADAVSAKVTSPQAAAEALTASNVVAGYLHERYWPALFARADDAPFPAFMPYSELCGAEFEDADTDAERAIERAMAEATSVDNTHPALADRLRAIGRTPSLALPSAHESAWQLLGTARERLSAALDRQWQDRVAADWHKHHEEVQQSRRRMAELDEVAASRDLEVHEAVERAMLEGARGAGIDAAIERLRAVHARASDDALVNYQLGAYLLERGDLERGDADGAALIERAIELDVSAATPGFAALRDFHWRCGDSDRALTFHQRHLAAADDDARAQTERSRLQTTDRFDAPDLDEAAMAKLAAELTRIGSVRRAWVARKVLTVRAQPPLHVLGFRVKRRFWRRDPRRELAVRDAILHSVTFPGETLVLCVDSGAARKIGAALSEIDGSQVPLSG